VQRQARPGWMELEKAASLRWFVDSDASETDFTRSPPPRESEGRTVCCCTRGVSISVGHLVAASRDMVQLTHRGARAHTHTHTHTQTLHVRGHTYGPKQAFEDWFLVSDRLVSTLMQYDVGRLVAIEVVD
jgi:hypothetical protein